MTYPTFADGYADAMQGNEPQSKEDEYVSGYNSLQNEVDSGFADLNTIFEITGAKNESTYKYPSV